MPEETAIIVPEAIHGTRIEKGTVKVEDRFEIIEYGKRVGTAKDYAGGHVVFYQLEERNEKINEINDYIDGYPLDVIKQFNDAMDVIYGFTHAVDRRGFFGMKLPPQRLSIKTGPGSEDYAEAVFGEMAPPSWEGGKIGMYVDTSKPLRLQFRGTLKQKFEPKFREVLTLTKELIKKNSIYAGKAVKLDLGYVESGEFDPMQCAPEFMTLEPQNLILNELVERMLKTYLWNPIRKPHKFRNSGVRLKSGLLFGGKHGTGKTMCLTETARIAIESGMTVLWLENNITAKTFQTAYNLARILSQNPAHGGCLFLFEDCDQIFGGERTPEMSMLFELLDGIDSKSKRGSEVIMVYTTNYLDAPDGDPRKLHIGFAPRRVDRIIVMGPPDAKAAWEFVQRNLGEYLAEGVDGIAVGETFAGMVQDDIDGACTSAKMYRLLETDDDESIVGTVNTEDLLLAAEEIRVKNSRSVSEIDPKQIMLDKLQGGVEVVMGTIMTNINVLKEEQEKQGKAITKIAKNL